MPGAVDAGALPQDNELEGSVLAKLQEILDRLNQMREEEGRGIDRELRQRMAHVAEAAAAVGQHRQTVLQTYVSKLKTRMQEMIGSHVDPERLLQEAAQQVESLLKRQGITAPAVLVLILCGVHAAIRRDGEPVAADSITAAQMLTALGLERDLGSAHPVSTVAGDAQAPPLQPLAEDNIATLSAAHAGKKD